MHASRRLANLEIFEGRMPKKIKTILDVREACVLVARAAIAEQGVENLSLRDVARRLGVSHQAPYKHYANRDALLAEVMRRCFENFAKHLDSRQRSEHPHEDMSSMGHEYLDYARNNPLEYRLMFGTPWPAAAEHPELVKNAQHAFDLLKEALRRTHGAAAEQKTIELDALFIWSALHGLSSILQSSAIVSLGLAENVLDEAPLHVLQRIGTGLAPR